jgi:hypothetical protein
MERVMTPKLNLSMQHTPIIPREQGIDMQFSTNSNQLIKVKKIKD